MGMYKKILIFAILVVFILSAIQPVQAGPIRALAAWQPFNQTLGDLKLQRTKTAIVNGIDGAITALNIADRGIERSKLTVIQKVEIKAQIESNVTWFEATKREVESSKNVSSALLYAKQARERWDEVYPGLKKEVGLMACDNLGVELNRARNATAIAYSKIDAMKAQGKDTGSLEGALAAYNGHIDSASRYVASARSEFNSISTSRLDGHFATGIKQLNLAEAEMKSAYSDLKNIYRLLLGNSVKATGTGSY